MVDWYEQGASVLPKVGTSRSNRVLAPAILAQVSQLLSQFDSSLRDSTALKRFLCFLRQEEASQS